MQRIRKVLGVFYFSLALAIQCSNADQASRPNIIFILADDVGREVLRCYGGQSYQTPNLDRLAAAGVRYEHAYAMPVCHPTRTTLLTSIYPFHLGHPNWGTFPHSLEARTLPSILRNSGYATVVAGKWQLALLGNDLDQPHRLGFDQYCLHGWHEGPWYYHPLIWQNGKRRTDVQDRYGPDVVLDFLLDFIRRNKDRPFFAWHTMSLCHAETNDLPKPAPVGPRGRYDSFPEMVAKMDNEVGRLLKTLDELDLRRRTLIILFSDNGTAAKNLADVEDGQYVYEPIVSRAWNRNVPGGKATLTDRGTRVPLILTWPGVIQVGAISDQLVDASDFLPSLVKLAHIQLPAAEPVDGVTNVAMTFDNKDLIREWVFAEHEGRCFVRDQRWKLYNDGRLFDMIADEEEQQPLSNDDLTEEARAAWTKLRNALNRLKYSANAKTN